ncbi:efflux RND transporter periplasmic adaptor subunit [Cohnella candidum]|nr:efflux RND transporter periplasmic adaptor subunit [Cohnella candidum]
MRWNKWWTIGTAAIVLAGAFGGYRWWSGKETKPLQAALQTTQVRKGNLEVKISGTGNIETANRETLSASSSGKIAAVKAKAGDKVKKGQVLATFEQSDNSSNTETQIRSKQLDVKKKELDLETMQTQYKEASDDDQRAQLLISIQKQQLDIETTKEDIKTLQEDESDSLDPITAPIDGTLATFNIKVGDTIGGQGGSSGSSSLGEVVDYDHLQMVVGVDELDIDKVKLNQKADVLVEAVPDQTFTGKVTSIAQEGTASNGVSTFDVTVSLDDVGSLKAGMSAEASILTQSKENALYLPIEAVQSFGGRYFVMVPDSTATVSTGGNAAGSGFRRQGQTGAAEGAASRSGQTGNAQGGTGTQSSGNFQGRGNYSGAAGQGTGQSGTFRQNRQFGAGTAQSGVRRVSIEVGIHNEDYIEVVSGLTEGEAVVVPTTAGSSTSTQNRNGAVGIPGLGIGGAGGFGGGGGFTGSGGFQRSGNGGNRTTRTQGGGGG